MLISLTSSSAGSQLASGTSLLTRENGAQVTASATIQTATASATAATRISQRASVALDAQDTATSYTPGGFSADAASGQVTLTGEQQYGPEDFYTGIPEALMSGFDAAETAKAAQWQAIAKDVAAGDLQAASSALASYQQLLPSSTPVTGTAKSMAREVAALGEALASGDQATATSALAKAEAARERQSDSVGMLLGKATQDAQSAPSWLQELANVGGTLSPATMGNVATGGDAFTRDLEGIARQMEQGAGDLTSYLESQGYSSSLAQADAQMSAYQNAVSSLGVVVHDVAEESGSTASYQISDSVVGVASDGASSRAFQLTTSESFAGDSGMNLTMTESELQTTANDAQVTAAVVEFGAPRPSSGTATVSVNRGDASAVLASVNGYSASFSVTEVDTEQMALASSKQVSSVQETGCGCASCATSQSMSANAASAWAAAAVWQQTVQSYSAGTSSLTVENADNSLTTARGSYETAYRQTLELVEMTAGSASAELHGTVNSFA